MSVKNAGAVLNASLEKAAACVLRAHLVYLSSFFFRVPLHAKNNNKQIICWGKKKRAKCKEPFGTKRGDESVECLELRLDVSDEGSGGE